MATTSGARSFERWPVLALAALITAYQRFVSPHTGFCCAHRVLHGGRSCSGHAKALLLRRGIAAAFVGMRRRFAACAAAALILAAAAAGDDDRARRERVAAAAEFVGDAGVQCCSMADAGGCVEVGACFTF